MLDTPTGRRDQLANVWSAPPDPCLLAKAAIKKDGAALVKGLLTVFPGKLIWSPDDPNSAHTLQIDRGPGLSE